MERRRFLGTAGAGLAGLAIPFAVRAQAWPSRPITFIYAYAAGGGGDPIARQLGEGLGAEHAARLHRPRWEGP